MKKATKSLTRKSIGHGAESSSQLLVLCGLSTGFLLLLLGVILSLLECGLRLCPQSLELQLQVLGPFHGVRPLNIRTVGGLCKNPQSSQSKLDTSARKEKQRQVKRVPLAFFRSSRS